MDLSKLNAPDKVLHYSYSFIISQCLYVAVKLNIADILSKKPLYIEELSKETNTNEDYLYRVMRLLVSVGIFKEKAGKVFHLSPEGAFLRKDFPGTLHHFVLMIGENWHWKTWGKFFSSICEGRPTIEIEYGIGAFEFLEKNEYAHKIMDKVLDDVTMQLGNFFVQNYNLEGVNKILDIGGGQGNLLKPALAKYKDLKVDILELPRLKEKISRTAGSESRITYIEGDFLKNIPEGYNLYIMKNILHDWDDFNCRKILTKCKDAMQPSNKLLIIENLITNDNQPSFSKFHDLEMLIIGGKERTIEEFKVLFEDYFRMENCIPLPFSQYIMELSLID